MRNQNAPPDVPVFRQPIYIKYVFSRSYGIGRGIMPLHTHDYYEMLLVLSDNVTHIANGTARAVQRGDLFILRPGDVHAARMDNPKKRSLLRDFYADTETFRAVCDFLDPQLFARLEASETPPATHISEEIIHALEDILKVPLYMSSMPFQMGLEAEVRTMQRSVLSMLLGSFAQESFRERQKFPTAFTALLDKLLDQEYRCRSIEDMAASVGYSREHLSREFKKAFGITLSQYLTTQRLERAAGQLANTDMAILAIAQDNGWKSQKRFSEAFRQLYGVDPRTYRTHTMPPPGSKTK